MKKYEKPVVTVSTFSSENVMATVSGGLVVTKFSKGENLINF
jgi:hypothetical protein